MTRPLIILGTLLALALALGYTFRDTLKERAYARLTADMFVAGDRDDFDPGPALDSHFPGIHADTGERVVRQLSAFAGPQGTVLVALRSLDWCPYCRRQMVELQAHREAFDAAGIGLVTITYDSLDQLRDFASEFGITVPLLSDVDALSFKTLGILNRDYQPGDPNYGIPYPGMIIVDDQGVVVGKLFLEDYSVRVGAEAALDFARNRLGIN